MYILKSTFSKLHIYKFLCWIKNNVLCFEIILIDTRIYYLLWRYVQLSRIRISKFRLGISWLPGSFLTVRRTFLRRWRWRRWWCRCPFLIFQFLVNAFLRTNDLGLQVERAALRSVISLHKVLVISLDQFRLIGTFRVQDTKGLFQGETGPGVGSDVLRSLFATARPPRCCIRRLDAARECFADDLRPHHDDLYQVLRHGLTSPRTFGTSTCGQVTLSRRCYLPLVPDRCWPVTISGLRDVTSVRANLYFWARISDTTSQPPWGT